MWLSTLSSASLLCASALSLRRLTNHQWSWWHQQAHRRLRHLRRPCKLLHWSMHWWATSAEACAGRAALLHLPRHCRMASQARETTASNQRQSATSSSSCLTAPALLAPITSCQRSQREVKHASPRTTPEGLDRSRQAHSSRTRHPNPSARDSAPYPPCTPHRANRRPEELRAQPPARSTRIAAFAERRITAADARLAAARLARDGERFCAGCPGQAPAARWGQHDGGHLGAAHAGALLRMHAPDSLGTEWARGARCLLDAIAIPS